jgi:large subunit ribosomal protein L13
MKTYVAKKEEIKQRKWYIVDASGKVLGRLATKVARVLTGKDKTTYTPHVDAGDEIIVINAKAIRVTGAKKPVEKLYKRFSGYPSGLKTKTLEMMMKDNPVEVIRHAVKGMLPKNRLGRKMMARLRVYAGDKHSHSAQNPTVLEV